MIVDSFNEQFSRSSFYESGLYEGGKPAEAVPKKEEIKSLPLGKFYGTLNGGHKVMLGIGLVSSFVAGLLIPSIAVVMGSVTGSFDPRNG